MVSVLVLDRVIYICFAGCSVAMAPCLCQQVPQGEDITVISMMGLLFLHPLQYPADIYSQAHS